MKPLLTLVFWPAVFAASTVHADWPCFLGPTQDLHAPAGTVLPQTLAGKPAWSIPVGVGFSGPVSRDGKVFLHYRQADTEVLLCADLATGKEVWKTAWPSHYDDPYGRGNGPRSTPCCDRDLIICLGPQGLLKTFSISDGKPVWQKDLLEAYSPPPSFFGIGFSPIVATGKLWLNVGGPEAGIVALDPATGKELHRLGGFKSSYATPVVWKDKKNQEWLGAVTREGFALINPRTAAVSEKMPFRSRMDASVNAASPVRTGDGLFLSACYGTGGWSLTGPKVGATTLWKNDKTLSSHFGTPLYAEGRLYGFHGRQEEGALLRCVDAAKGQVLWEKEGLGTGWVMLAGNDLIVVGEKGDLLVGAANAKALEPRLQAVPFTAPVLAAPAWDQGHLLVRDAKALHGFLMK